MSSKLPNIDPSSRLKANILPDATSDKKTNVFDKNISGGKSTSRVEIQLFEGNNFTDRVAIKDFPDGPDGEKLLREHQKFWWQRFLWVPLKVKTSQGVEKTVLVNVNSLAKRLGISKTLARKTGKMNRDGSELARILNKMQSLNRALNPISQEEVEKAEIIRIVNFMEKHKELWVESEPKSPIKPLKTHSITHSNFKGALSPGKAFIHIKDIGQGAFKEIKLAFNYVNGLKIAMGSLKAGRAKSRQSKLEFKREAAFNWRYKDCEGLVRSYGVVNLANGQRALVQKYYLGDLLNFNESKRNSATEKDIVKMMLNMAKGLGKLHTDNVVHRDIKPENCYFDEDKHGYTAVLGDFGLALEFTPQKPNVSGLKGTVTYTAPELFRQKSYDLNSLKASDVWALGCTWCELFTSIPAWVNRINAMAQDGVLLFDDNRLKAYYSDLENEIDGSRAMLDYQDTMEQIFLFEAATNAKYGSELGTQIAELIGSMLDLDPNKRPTMEQVTTSLQTILASV